MTGHVTITCTSLYAKNNFPNRRNKSLSWLSVVQTNLKTSRTDHTRIPSKSFHFDNTELQSKTTAKRNMSSAMCASSMYSCLFMKMSSFLFVRACAMRGYVIFIMWNFISGLDAWYLFQLIISRGVVLNKKIR